jgi:DNA-binding GntR family transcriptional regulator
MALEPLAAREGVNHLTTADFQAMERHMAEMERALREDDRGRFLDHDQAFRTILFRASGLEFLCQLISTVWDGVTHHQRAAIALSGQAERYLENYRRLLLAARAGQVEVVEAIIRDDLDASRQGLIRFLEVRARTAEH